MSLLAGSLISAGRIKEGSNWFTYVYTLPDGTTPANRVHRLRYHLNLLIVEINENNAGWRIASREYIANYADLAFAQASVSLLATQAQLQSAGMGEYGATVPFMPTTKDIPFEANADGRIVSKALPVENAEVVEKLAQTTSTIANLVGTGSTGTGTAGSSANTQTRQILGWVLIGLGVTAAVVGVVAIVRYLGKRKK